MAFFEKKNNQVETEKNYESDIQEKIENLKENSGVALEDRGIKMKPEYWGILWPLISDTEVTDIDYNGESLWVTDVNGNRSMADMDLSKETIDTLINRISMQVGKEFNILNPILEAETEELRFIAVHSSTLTTGNSFSIRKTPLEARINAESAYTNNYASPEMLAFLANCVKTHMNIVICGEPGVGKTELSKFLSTFIKDNERVITVEDTLEWHYRHIHPFADCLEVKVSDILSYKDVIKASMRLNPKWLMLSEARGEEVTAYIEALSTGVCGITSIHCDDIRNVPERLINMSTDKENKKRMENDIYSFLNVLIFLERRRSSNGYEERYIDQIGVLDPSNHQIHILFENGEPYIDLKNTPKDQYLSYSMKKKFNKAGIDNVWENSEIDSCFNKVKKMSDYHKQNNVPKRVTAVEDAKIPIEESFAVDSF